MGRTAKNRSTPHLPPVKRIELSAAHTRLRAALALLLLAVGLGAFGYALTTLLTPETGWIEIEANPSAELNCAEDFVFLYPLGATGASPTVEKKALATLYTQATVTAHQLFTNDADYDGLRNVRFLNRHPNEELAVDPALYNAFAQIAASGDRSLYLAPIFSTYDGIFYCADDALTADFDPRQSDELRAWFLDLCSYANDPAQVNLDLLGENRVRLSVSDDYLAYAEAEGIESFIDFYWMKNAFIADYLADALILGGYRIGTLSSFDGFSRNLDAGSSTSYSLNIYDRVGQNIYPAATMRYSGARSIVSLRNYPANGRDALRFYSFANGEIRNPYLDARDGLCRSALNDLTAYSADKSCAEILLELIPIYIADEFDPVSLDALAASGIRTIYCEDRTIHHTEPNLELTDLYSDDAIQYKRAP